MIVFPFIIVTVILASFIVVKSGGAKPFGIVIAGWAIAIVVGIIFLGMDDIGPHGAIPGWLAGIFAGGTIGLGSTAGAVLAALAKSRDE